MESIILFREVVIKGERELWILGMGDRRRLVSLEWSSSAGITENGA